MTDPVEDPPRPSTIAEVASIARVSVGTVSNYLNQPEVVAEATRTRIAEAIDQVGWIPNIAVRTVRRGRSSLIGLVLSDVSNVLHRRRTTCRGSSHRGRDDRDPVQQRQLDRT